MRKFIIAGLMATVLLPAAAQAHYGRYYSDRHYIDRHEARELRQDRRRIVRERHDLRHALRFGDRRDIRDERNDLRKARREFREDLRDARRDWRHAG